jgi:hypothetical protein
VHEGPRQPAWRPQAEAVKSWCCDLRGRARLLVLNVITWLCVFVAADFADTASDINV